MLRELMKREIEKVQRGLDPIALVRDPDHAMIDTNLTESMALARQRLARRKASPDH